MKLLIITPKEVYATKRFLEEAEKLGVFVVCKSSRELADDNWQVDASSFDALYIRQVNPYYSEVEDLAQKFFLAGKKVVDKISKVSGIDDNKINLLTQMQEVGLPLPGTVFYPDLYVKHFPVYVKWAYGSKGQHNFLVSSHEELASVYKKYPPEELFIQEYVEADYEYKVVCVGFKSLPVVIKYEIDKKTKKPDLEKFKLVDKTSATELLNIAESVSRLLGRELSKVDILEKSGKYFLLEVNRMPGLQNLEVAMKMNLAKIFLEYILFT